MLRIILPSIDIVGLVGYTRRKSTFKKRNERAEKELSIAVCFNHGLYKTCFKPLIYPEWNDFLYCEWCLNDYI